MVALAAPPQRVQRYTPVGAARDLIAAREPEVVAIGPAGTGKTLAACWKVHLAALRYPGARILMARKTLESLKSGALNTYINGVMPTLAGVQTFGGNKFFPAEFRYPNGSVVLVSGMDKADKILSAEFDMVYVNEVTEPGFTDHDWQTLKTRLRNGKMPYQQMVADGNPQGPRHWMRLRTLNGQTRLIQSTHRDNPAYWDTTRNDWTELGRRYVQENLESLTGIARKRLLDGLWAAAEGLVYPEFTPEMIRPMDVTGWRTVLGVDIGSKNPTGILAVHIAGDERVHISEEVYRRNMTSTDIVAAVSAFADRHDPDAIYIDPSAKGYIDDLHRLGYPAIAATNDVLVGIQRVRGAFQHGLTIDPSCVNTIDELGMYAYPDNPRIETDKPVKEYDHCLIAGTMVETSTGSRSIETIHAGDQVLTRDGFRPVLAAGLTNPTADVLTVHLSDGRTLTGTAGHPVWVSNRGGWNTIDTLRYGDIMKGIQEAPSCVSSPSSTVASPSGAIPTPSGLPIVGTTVPTVPTSPMALRRYIAKYGGITTGQSRSAGTSITSTATPTTTTSTIWNACRRSIISRITARISQTSNSRNAGRTWTRRASRPLRGIGRTRGGHGIALMAGRGGWIASPLRVSVSSAAAPISLVPSSAITGSAPTSASPHGAGRLASMMKTGHAPSAAARSASIGTAGSEHAPVFVVRVSAQTERQAVYNLTVAGTPEYFANGVLVHNCMDAMRYALVGALTPTVDLEEWYQSWA